MLEYIDFEKAKALIKAGEIFDINKIDFDINQYDEETEFDVHTSENYDNDIWTTTNRTLLHIAIDAGNVEAVVSLLNAGADKDMPVVSSETRNQRCKKDDGSWSKPKKWKPRGHELSTIKFAELKGNTRIIGLIKGAIDPKSVTTTPIETNEEKSHDEVGELADALAVKASLTESTESPYMNRIVKKTGRNTKYNRPVTLYGFPDSATVFEREKEWQQKAMNKFFRIGKELKEGKHADKLYKRVVKWIENNETNPIGINGLCRRSFIIAMSKVLTHYGEMPEISFKLGLTTLKFQKPEYASSRQKGNFKLYIPELKTRKGDFQIKYGAKFYNRIKYLVEASWDDEANKRRRKENLNKLIRTNLPLLKPFRPSDFNKYGNIRAYPEDSGYHSDDGAKISTHLMNGFIFLITVVEVLVRLYRTEEGELFNYDDDEGKASDSLPVAIAQARSLMLVLEGKIAFNDFIGESRKEGYDSSQHRAYYGLVTGLANMDYIDVMLKKLMAINTKYNAAVSGRSFWKDISKDYREANPEGVLILGRSRMYCTLRDAYGHGSESGDESSDYSDSEEFDEEVVDYSIAKT